MKSTRTIILVWLAWAIIVLSFQGWATARIDPKYPDRAQEWTSQSTYEGYQDGTSICLIPS